MTTLWSFTCSHVPCVTNRQLQLYEAIILGSPFLFAVLFLLLFYIVICMVRRNRNTGVQLRSYAPSRGFIYPVQVERGLSKVYRHTLPTFSFDDNFTAAHDDVQCAVCLADYQLHEKLQQLPVCKHSFHVACIDMWLSKNNTCPMCRTSLLQRGGEEHNCLGMLFAKETQLGNHIKGL